jgi:hypothetical protein
MAKQQTIFTFNWRGMLAMQSNCTPLILFFIFLLRSFIVHNAKQEQQQLPCFNLYEPELNAI